MRGGSGWIRAPHRARYAGPSQSRIRNSQSSQRNLLSHDYVLGDFRDAWSCRRRDCFPHANLGAVPFERDFVHQLIDQINSTAVSGLEILRGERIGQRAWDESLTRIAYHDDHVRGLGAGYAALYFLSRIVVASVDDRVGERLA